MRVTIPKKATNGEALMALFPDMFIIKRAVGYVEVSLDGNTVFRKEWWNEPYTGGDNDGN